MSDHLPPSSELPTPPSGTPVPHDPVSPLTQQPAPSPPLLSHPQIIAALITGMISIVVAVVGILPALMDSDNQTPTPTVSVAALVSPTNEPPLPTVVPTGQPAAAVTALPVLPITPVAGETIPRPAPDQCSRLTPCSSGIKTRSTSSMKAAGACR
ncbi:MAG: hypothetical protein HND48_00105 [Chloroflexi bacterium]|nr:hypothetical protein [Chloroflexota bacterium]